jgi:hypothetical protein
MAGGQEKRLTVRGLTDVIPVSSTRPRFIHRPAPQDDSLDELGNAGSRDRRKLEELSSRKTQRPAVFSWQTQFASALVRILRSSLGWSRDRRKLDELSSRKTQRPAVFSWQTQFASASARILRSSLGWSRDRRKLEELLDFSPLSGNALPYA